MSCHASDSPLVAIVSDSKPSKSIAVGIFFDKYKAPYEVGIEPTNADFYTGSVITVVSKANPEDPTVVLHGQGTALLTPEIFGGDISSAAITNLAIQLLLLVPFKTICRSLHPRLRIAVESGYLTASYRLYREYASSGWDLNPRH